jgi:Tfp pilus assembly protein PilV
MLACMKRVPLNRRRTRGFTILEVAMAGFVLTLAIAGSITTLQMGYRAIDNARYTTLAGQILQSQMEKLRLLTWTQLTNATTGPVAYTTFTPDISSTTTAQLNRFTTTTGGAGTCAQTITAAPAPFDTTMKDITLTATWTSIDGKSHSLSYTTRYGQNGISDFFYTSH